MTPGGGAGDLQQPAAADRELRGEPRPHGRPADGLGRDAARQGGIAARFRVAVAGGIGAGEAGERHEGHAAELELVADFGKTAQHAGIVRAGKRIRVPHHGDLAVERNTVMAVAGAAADGEAVCPGRGVEAQLVVVDAARAPSSGSVKDVVP